MARTDRAAAFRSLENRVLDRFLPGAIEHRVPTPTGDVRLVAGGEGPVLVFVHGITGTLTNFASLAGAMVDRCRCVLIDLPGHGLSDPVDFSGLSPRAVLTDALRAVADDVSAGEPVALAGNSLGGMVSLYLAADDPERVAAVAVLGEPAYAFRGARARFPLTLVGAPIVGRLMLSSPAPRPLFGRIAATGFGKTARHRIDADVLDLHRLSVAAGGQARSVNSLMRRLMGSGGEAADGVALAAGDYDRIRMPLWFLWGTDDPFQSPESGRPSVDRFVDARIDVIEAGHAPWLDAPDLTRRRLGELLDRAGL